MYTLYKLYEGNISGKCQTSSAYRVYNQSRMRIKHNTFSMTNRGYTHTYHITHKVARVCECGRIGKLVLDDRWRCQKLEGLVEAVVGEGHVKLPAKCRAFDNFLKTNE